MLYRGMKLVRHIHRDTPPTKYNIGSKVVHVNTMNKDSFHRCPESEPSANSWPCLCRVEGHEPR
eukprot:4129537-Amphidinium_carterae.1